MWAGWTVRPIGRGTVQTVRSWTVSMPPEMQVERRLTATVVGSEREHLGTQNRHN